MRPTPKTLGLLLMLIILGAVNIVDRDVSELVDGGLPFLSPIALDDATHVEITTAAEKIVLERNKEGEGWTLTAPLLQEADMTRIRGLLQAFRKEVPMDVRVDSGDPKAYGLDASDGIVVEIWTGRDAPEISITIGNVAPGGANFVRLSGDDGVYRARVGGRGRFKLSPADWRNRALIDLTESEIQGISVKPQAGDQLHLIREQTSAVDELGTPLLGPWRVDGSDEISPEDLIRLATAVGRLRASEILAEDFDGGFSPPAAEITVIDNAANEITMAIGTRQAKGSAFVRVQGAQAVYRVPGRLIEVLLQLAGTSKATGLNIYRMDPTTIAAMIYYEGRTQVEIAPNDNRVWTIRSPQGISADVKDIEWAVNTLANPSAVAVVENKSAAAAGLKRPKMVFEVQRTDGSHEALYIGRAFVDKNATTDKNAVHFYAMQQGSETIYAMDEPTLTRIRLAFGQG